MLLPLSRMHCEPTHTLTEGPLSVTVAVDSSHLEPTYGPRFDRTATVTSVRYDGAEFLDPRGLPDEFGITGVGVLGYAEAGIAGTFIKIGVGRIRRVSSAPYSFIPHYPVEAHFPVTVQASPQSLVVEQQSDPVAGYGYRYRKAITVHGGGIVEIAYALTNTGEHPFEFEQYNHNFFHFAQQPSDAAYVITTGFDLPGEPPAAWHREGRTLSLTAAAPERGGASWPVAITAPAADNRVTVRHRNGQHVICTGDFAVSRFAVWSIRAAFSPEIFVRAALAPGARREWTRRYQFGLGAANSTPDFRSEK